MKTCDKCGKKNQMGARYCAETSCRNPLPMLDAFTQAYIECALWASTDEEGATLDCNYNASDLSPETLAAIEEDCKDFQESFGKFFEGREEEAGHDFFLTRNRHGAGFWDGNWNQPAPIKAMVAGRLETYCDTVGDYLTKMSRPYGSFGLYVGNDGRIYHHS